jgi:hypothetical protein
MPYLRQAIAGGQYEFPQGLYFGGKAPSQSHNILKQNMRRWLQGSEQVIQLDFHTGLGKYATCKLLIDYPLTDGQRRWLTDCYGNEAFGCCNAANGMFATKGDSGCWCAAQEFASNYLHLCAEFGTYSPIRVLAGLRAENQAHHWGDPQAASTARAKSLLHEMFCPASRDWRVTALRKSRELIARSIEGLT